MMRHVVQLLQESVVFALLIVFAARVAMARAVTRVVQDNHGYDDSDIYLIQLEMAIFDTSSTSVQSGDSIEFIISALNAAIQSVLCEMNENVILVDSGDNQYSYQCGEEAIDASDLSSYILLSNLWSYWCKYGSGKFSLSSCSFEYRVLQLGDNYTSSFLGDTTTTTTKQALKLLQKHWQSILDSRCTDGTFNALLQNFAVSREPSIYCCSFADAVLMKTKWAALEDQEPKGSARGTIGCSVFWTTIVQWVGLGLPHFVAC